MAAIRGSEFRVQGPLECSGSLFPVDVAAQLWLGLLLRGCAAAVKVISFLCEKLQWPGGDGPSHAYTHPMPFKAARQPKSLFQLGFDPNSSNVGKPVQQTT